MSTTPPNPCGRADETAEKRGSARSPSEALGDLKHAGRRGSKKGATIASLVGRIRKGQTQWQVS